MGTAIQRFGPGLGEVIHRLLPVGNDFHLGRAFAIDAHGVIIHDVREGFSQMAVGRKLMERRSDQGLLHRVYHNQFTGRRQHPEAALCNRSAHHGQIVGPGLLDPMPDSHHRLIAAPRLSAPQVGAQFERCNFSFRQLHGQRAA